jgi:hypothetical protein
MYTEEDGDLLAAQLQSLKILDALKVDLSTAIREVEVAGPNWNIPGDKVPVSLLREAGDAFDKEFEV